MQPHSRVTNEQLEKHVIAAQLIGSIVSNFDYMNFEFGMS